MTILQQQAKSKRVFPGGVLGLTAAILGVAIVSADDRIVKQEFIFEQAPFDQCHASTIEETDTGLVAAWFGGEREGDSSVGIWLSRHDGEAWSPPLEVANGNQTSGDVQRYPCWNPVLFQADNGPLLLFYKVGPNPREWWGMLLRSNDDGKSWSQPERLPDGILGPIRAKPIQLADGTILCGSSSEHDGWRVHFERTNDLGKTWKRTPAINTGQDFGIIQPTIFVHKDGSLRAYCRSRQRKIVETISTDQGLTWSKPKATELPNPSAGVDGVTLKDGTHALIYNHTPRGRTPLNLAFSGDVIDWNRGIVLESAAGEFSYPAIIQTRDGKLHMTYTWKRNRVKHVVVDPPHEVN